MDYPGCEGIRLDLSLICFGLPVNDCASQGLDQKRDISVAIVIEELWDYWEEQGSCQLNTEQLSNIVVVNRDSQKLSCNDCLNKLVYREL